MCSTCCTYTYYHLIKNPRARDTPSFCNRYGKKKKMVKVLNVIIWANTEQPLVTDASPLIKLSCPTIASKPCQCSCEVSTSWSLICTVCSVESASRGRSPVRLERKCVFSGSGAAGLMSEPLTADSDPCSVLQPSSALLPVRVRAISLPLLLSYL